MRNSSMLAILALATSKDIFEWLLRLGGIGLIPLGLLDSSFIPLPGSMDVATILLSARERNLWFYYAIMATVGSVIGGFLTYRLARKGGKETLSRRFPRRDVQKVYKQFERWGFAAIFIPALLPPPMPIVPFLVAAGALQYSVTKFLTALALGRALRYTILAFLGVRYGGHILTFISQHGLATVYIAIAVSVATVVSILVIRRIQKKKKSAKG